MHKRHARTEDTYACMQARRDGTKHGPMHRASARECMDDECAWTRRRRLCLGVWMYLDVVRMGG